MTVPAPTHTRTPTAVTLTLAAPVATVVLDDTGTYTPAPTARQWKDGAANIAGATGDPQTVKVFGASPTITVSVTNTDGTAASTGSAVTVTDNIAADVTAALAAGGPQGNRILPAYLPWQYRDPTMATPGTPTAKNVYTAEKFGTIIPAHVPNVGV